MRINPPKCKMCDNPVKMDYTKKTWRTYCSPSCVKSDIQSIQSNREITNLTKYGVSVPAKNPQVREKQQQTCFEKYGKNHSFNHEQIKETFFDKFGGYPTQNTEVIKTREQNNLKKFGYIHPRQNKEIQEKQKQTNLKKYSVEHPWANKQIRINIAQTMLAKYGVEHFKQKEIINVLSLIQDPDWLIDQYIIQNKTVCHIAQELDINDTTIGKYLKKAEIEIKKTQQSYVSKLWLTQIQEQENIEIVYEYQWDKNNLRTKADGYCQETNTIYEFHGNYWHGNPSIYASDIIHPIIKKTMGELYRKTIQREERIKSLGYNLVIMWESAFTS